MISSPDVMSQSCARQAKVFQSLRLLPNCLKSYRSCRHCCIQAMQLTEARRVVPLVARSNATSARSSSPSGDKACSFPCCTCSYGTCSGDAHGACGARGTCGTQHATHGTNCAHEGASRTLSQLRRSYSFSICVLLTTLSYQRHCRTSKF